LRSILFGRAQVKICYLSEFDPAGVMIAQRDALRQFTDWDVSVGLRRAYCHKADADAGIMSNPDVIVVCPGIGTGVAGGEATSVELPAWVEAILDACPSAKRVAYFHGSRDLTRQGFLYHDRYQMRGFHLAASTLDYASWMSIAWLPPVVSLNGYETAELWNGKNGLMISHAPSDPSVCNTRELLYSAITQGVGVHYISGRPHHQALALKRMHPVGFDHLRGAFSVNTIEFAGLGMVPLVGLHSSVKARMEEERLPMLPGALSLVDGKSSELQLAERIRTLRDNVNCVQATQEAALNWYNENMRPDRVINRVTDFFEKVMSC
jgi:hypothetical protein